MAMLYTVLVLTITLLQCTAHSPTNSTNPTQTTSSITPYITFFDWNSTRNDSNFWSQRQGNVLNVNAALNETTVEMSCQFIMMHECLDYWPTTVILAPTKIEYASARSWWTTTGESTTCFITSTVISCDIASTVYCYTTVETSLVPYPDPTSIYRSEAVQSMPSSALSSGTVSITKGIENLYVTSCPTTSSAPTEDEDEDDHSQAWVAGPVIGAIAGCGIIVGVIFWFIQRRSRALSKTQEQEAVHSRSECGYNPVLPVQELSDTRSHEPPMYEL
ncbi:hypothetical protein BJX99DRAFT_262475 [Aspergillus californicus]